MEEVMRLMIVAITVAALTSSVSAKSPKPHYCDYPMGPQRVGKGQKCPTPGAWREPGLGIHAITGDSVSGGAEGFVTGGGGGGVINSQGQAGYGSW
jgi:hypothetical protein